MSLLEQFQQIFGERIKKRRRELRLTQLELSGRLHISRTMLANIETGTQRTSVFLLARMSQILDVSTEDLVPNLAEAEARSNQTRKVFLATQNNPTLLSRELEALNISIDPSSTLEEALKEIRSQHSRNKTTNAGGNNDD